MRASQPGIHHLVLGLLLLYLPFLILHQCFLTGGCRPFGWDLLHCTGIAEPRKFSASLGRGALSLSPCEGLRPWGRPYRASYRATLSKLLS